MTGGSRNPFTMSRLLHTLHDVAHDAKGNAHDLSKVTREFMADKVVDVAYHDLTIQVRHASLWSSLAPRTDLEIT